MQSAGAGGCSMKSKLFRTIETALECGVGELVMDNQKIAEELIKTYRDDGVVCLRGVISQEWLDLLAEAFEEAEATPNQNSERVESGGRFFNSVNVWRSNEKARRFVFESPLASLAAQLMDASQVLMYGDHLLLKDPGCRTKSPWHQDLPYFPLSGEQIGAFWVGLDPVTKESGAVQFIRGSHRWDGLFIPPQMATAYGERSAFDLARSSRRPEPDEHEVYHDLPDIAANPDLYDIICYELQPGDCTFHNVKLLHGASGNDRLDVPRRGWSVRMCGDTTTYYHKPTSRDPDAPTLPDGALIESDIYPQLWP